MATETNNEKIVIGINDKVIELKGKELEAFLSDREMTAERTRLIEAEQQAKEAAKASAMDKLKKLGLTDEEIEALVP
jgi:hypothetical protein